MQVAGFDTGGCTGVALWVDDGSAFGHIWSDAVPRAEAEDLMVDVIPKCDQIVVERLSISVATGKKGRQIQEAIELVGLARYLARKYDIPMIEQSPAEAKGFATDAKLKRIGWYVKGPDHQNDARRHVLTHLADQKLIDLIQLLRGTP